MEKVIDHIRDALALGATCVHGGLPTDELSEQGGYFVQPTVLVNISKQMKVYKVFCGNFKRYSDTQMTVGGNIWSGGVGDDFQIRS